MLKRAFLLLIVILMNALWVQHASAQALLDDPNTDIAKDDNNDPLITPAPWPGDFFDSFRENFFTSVNSGADSLTVGLFDTISNLDLFSETLGPGTIGINVQRRIFDNHDISSSWTVMDSFRLPYTVPLIPSTSIPIGGPFSTNISATAQIALSTIHMRQVFPKHFKGLPKVVELKEDLENVQTQALDMLTPEQKKKMKSTWQTLKNFFQGDFSSPRLRAQFNKIYNLFLSPLGFPFTEGALSKMPEGDVRVFAYEGMLQLGASIGFNVSAIPGIDLFNMGLGPSIYLSGRWQVAIAKLSGNRLKVKITRINNNGRVFQFGSYHQWTVFKGFVVLGGNVGTIRQTLVPFQFSLGKDHANQFDIGYEFDLNKPEALDAAQKIIFGQSLVAEGLSRKKDSGVVWNFRRNQKAGTVTMSSGLKMEFLVYFQRVLKTQKIDALITLPDGEHHYFKGTSDSIKAWDSLFGGREFRHYSFQAFTDSDAFDTGGTNSMSLKLSGKIEDARTTGRELKKYTQEIETALRNQDLFPEYPTHIQKKRCLIKCKMVSDHANYGPSSFYYRLSFNKLQIDHLIWAQEEDVWRALERAYKIAPGQWHTAGKRRIWGLKYAPLTALNVPLALVQTYIKTGGKLISASRFYKKWKRLKSLTHDGRNLTFELADLLKTQHFGPEYINTMVSLSGEGAIPYAIQANNAQLFSNMFVGGESLLNRDLPLDIINRSIDFEQPEYWQKINVDDTASGFSIRKLSPEKIEVKIHLKRDPKFIFFSIGRKKVLRYSHLDNLILSAINGEEVRFKKGDNIFVISRKEENAWKKRLSNHLFSKGITQLQLSYTTAIESGWGPLYATSVTWTEDQLNPMPPAEIPVVP